MENLLYKASHINHPCGIWLRESAGNYNYLYTLFACLSKEYTHRYGRVHLTWEKLGDLLKHIPDNIQVGEKTTMPQAMPDYCKTDNVIVAYRNYYKGEKMDFVIISVCHNHIICFTIVRHSLWHSCFFAYLYIIRDMF
jgi:hypothetical protein